MSHTKGWGLAWLLLGLAGTAASGLQAQAGDQALRIVATSPNGPATSGVTQATIRFSEPMVPLGGSEVDAVSYVHVTPDVPVGFRWADTNVLVVIPKSGRFPSATACTIRIDAEAAATSGRRLGAPHTFTFTTPSPRLTGATLRPRMRDGRRVDGTDVALTFDLPVRDLTGHIGVVAGGAAPAVPALSPEARTHMARVDPDALKRRDEWTAALVTRFALPRPLDIARVRIDYGTVVLELAETAPAGAALRVTATGVPSPEGPLLRPTPDVVAIQGSTLFTVTGPECQGLCEVTTAYLRPSDGVDRAALRAAVRVTDVTDPAAERLLAPGMSEPRRRYDWFRRPYDVALSELGYTFAPGRRYAVAIDAGLRSVGGARLDAAWMEVFGVGHLSSQVGLGAEQGLALWESGSGPRLPVLSRSMRDLRVGADPVSPGRITTLASIHGYAGSRREDEPATTRTEVVADPKPGEVTETMVDIAPALSAAGHGLVLFATAPGQDLPGVATDVDHEPRSYARAALVQVTNIGLTVRSGNAGAAILATRLDTGAPVASADLTLLDDENVTLWRGRTDADGLAVATPVGDTNRREPSTLVAEKDGDVAFAKPFFLEWRPRAMDSLVGVLFTDRGVYRPGESARVKALMRMATPSGLKAVPAGTPVTLTLERDGDEQGHWGASVDARGGAEWTVPLSADAGVDRRYVFRMTLDAAKADADEEHSSRYSQAAAMLSTELLIKAIKPVEFQVTLSAARRDAQARPTIGARLGARDLSDVALGQAPASFKVTRRWIVELPKVLEDDHDFRYSTSDTATERTFLPPGHPFLIERPGTLDSQGELATDFVLPEMLAGRGTFTVAAEVRDTSSQVQGRSVTVTVHPDAYLGVGPDPSLETKVRLVARTPEGALMAGVPVELRFWPTDKDERTAVLVKATTGKSFVTVPVPPTLAAASGSRGFQVSARATSPRLAIMPTQVWLVAKDPPVPTALPEASLSLTLDRQTYQPGDRARLAIASRWARAGTALVTIERGGLVAAHAVRLTDGRATLDLAVGDSALEGLQAAVTLVRGRASPCCADGVEDPGRPDTVSETIAIPIDRASTVLQVTLDAPASARPGQTAHVRVRVRDHAGRPVQGAVTLWGVDEGVLALTTYRVVDPAPAFFEPRLGELWTTDSRELLLRRRLPRSRWDEVQTSTAGRMLGSPVDPVTLAGGEDGPEPAVRRDLRPLAFWFGALETDADGVAEVDAALPDTLTTYRVMALAATDEAQFGRATASMLVTKPVMARPAIPRFMTRLDSALLRTTVAVAGVQGVGSVVVESLTPALLEVDAAPQRIEVAAGGRAVAAVTAVARAMGTARIRVTATVGGARDVIERDIPILDGTLPGAAVAVGEAAPEAIETIRPPAAADPTAGGLDIELASTMLVGLSAAGDYVRDYPYLCAEQGASRALVLVLSSVFGRTFTFLGDGPAAIADRRAEAQHALDALGDYECPDGYSYWKKGDCRESSPYLASYVLLVYQTAGRHGFAVPPERLAHAAEALEASLRRPRVVGGIFDDAAWRAFAVKVLADAGRRPQAALDASWAMREDLPIFGLAHLLDAQHAIDPTSPRVAELQRMIRNHLTVGATAHVEERSGPYVWCWPSSRKSTAIVLDVLVRTRGLSAEEARPIVSWLLAARRQGIWSGTQENVWALVALASYRQAFEPGTNAVTASARLEGADLARHALDVRRPTASRTVPMRELTTLVMPGATGRLIIGATGSGPVFYTARLGFRLPAREAPPIDHGIALSRRYVPMGRGTGASVAPTTFAAGDLIRVELSVRLSEARTFVAVSDALPAGFEVVDVSLDTTAPAAQAAAGAWSWQAGFNRIERYDQRVDLFATSLSAGTHAVSYLVRATTPGTFFAAPTRAEAMYEPEVAGRGAGATIVVSPTP